MKVEGNMKLEGKRKLLMGLIAGVAMFLVEGLGWDPAQVDRLQEVVVWLVALYFGGNVLEHFTGAMKVWAVEKFKK